MWNYIEKYFPEITNYIKSISVGRRVLLAFLFVLVFFVLSYSIKNKTFVFELFKIKIEIAPLIPLIIFLAILLIISLLIVLYYLRKRSHLSKFCTSWVQFSDFLFLFITKVDAYLLHEEKTKSGKFDELMPEIKKYHEYRKNLRELLHQVKEKNLIVSKIANWDEMKRKHPIFEERQYETPFSFLLDFKNPIAFLNLHGKEAWEAMHVSNEFIEYLTYEHSYLKRKLKPA